MRNIDEENTIQVQERKYLYEYHWNNDVARNHYLDFEESQLSTA